MEEDLTALLRFLVQVNCQALGYCVASALLCILCADQDSC